MKNCYISRLTVKQVGHKDSRKYLVTVTNMHGSDTAPVHLTVRGKYLFESEIMYSNNYQVPLSSVTFKQALIIV